MKKIFLRIVNLKIELDQYCDLRCVPIIVFTLLIEFYKMEYNSLFPGKMDKHIMLAYD